MKPAELLKKCEEIYTSYNPSKVTVDTHAERFIVEQKIKEGGDALFLKQVLYGCVRYKKVLKIAVTHFYTTYSGSLIRSDFTMYMVLSYLAIFRLKDLSFPIFRQFLMSQEAQKMYLFTSFMFDAETLENVLKEEWLKHFDRAYVEDTLIANLLSFTEELAGTVELLETKTKGTRSKKTSSGGTESDEPQTTVLQPFNLTRPNPRKVPEPEKMESDFKAKDVPQAIYDGPRQLQQRIEDAKRQNKLELEKKYTSAAASTMKFRTADRPSNLEKIKREVEEEREANLNFEGIKAKPAPKFRPHSGNKVKLNMAAILREEAVYKKQQEQEAALLKAYEAELRDASSYDQWQSEMKAKDDEAKRKEVERRRMEMAMADLEAKEAREQKILENKMKAAQMQREAVELLEKKKDEEEKEHEELKRKVEEVIVGREATRQAVEETKLEKAKVVSEVAAEKREMRKKIEEEKEKELQEKADLVRQIRAAESLIAGTGGGGLNSKPDMFDPTETGGHNLLEEMSVAELRERLAMIKVREMEEREEKRQEIIAAKQQKEREIMEKVQLIQNVRLAAERQNLQRRKERAEGEIKENEVREKERHVAMQELNKKLDAKKKARLEEQAQLEREMRATRLRKQFLQADKDMVEEKRYRDLERGAERDVVMRQKAHASLAARTAAAKAKDEKNRESVAKKLARETKQRLRDIDEKLEVDREETMQFMARESDVRGVMAKSQRDRERALWEETAARQPYATKISQQTLTSKIKPAVGGGVAAKKGEGEKRKKVVKVADPLEDLKSQLAPARYDEV
eukprot:CAMPEP_0113895456 /NCGR_PEP_ID=MMETSP0780_2-20120614/17373_1 /TAXON_ID=652834 /ORGANISM="Palpitomonas bilix" /LENGTH=799 /DNA_ID=CAMNT_0000886289 /DNA_START=165 /DNA_END=2564 /DNA_ORIENTATION=+ /assembly_acc=CAM_ASM_000599